ncbi:hypothetical protein [Paraflavitalea speifideaquila]|uniref:hypothetical protein n=1 Tax=Paraflavitalea speifideaquila TaxID=3076558 RepID=UPI0028EA0E35|nr:hypothetical protein [Paraflavitalea speifideiaquila]
MKNVCWMISIALMAFLQISCKSNDSNAEVPAAREAHEGEHKNENTATFTADQVKSIGIELGEIEENN